MIISLKWLKNYIDLDNITTQDIVDKLTSCGAEVEEVIDRVADFTNIVVGKVDSVEKHPNADRLSVCEVFDGEQTYSVVCGAPNVEAGLKVPFAKPGAKIPNGGFEIKSTKIRGIKSSGMICAEDELGLSEDHSGIMVLDPNAEIGQPLAKCLDLEDAILDIAITPNRADALCHIGIARDLAAIYGKDLKYPKVNQDVKIAHKNEYAEVIIENAKGCPRYSAVIIKGVEVKESPNWMKDRLKSIGLRPINNIVDVTNFILYEIGQPLHAFDLSQLSANKIIVKNNGEKSNFITLDSKERSMLPDDLMICDGEKPVAIAGVMGGENSEVTVDTQDILIESAYFDPSRIRKTSRHLGISTDSSYRFERGTDPNGTLRAALRAAELIVQIAGGEIIRDVIDVYPLRSIEKEVELRYSRIEKILGFSIERSKIINILEGLELSILSSDENKVLVKVPTFRHDIEREIDLIEEIVRIFGFDKVPTIHKIGVVLDSKIDQTSFSDHIRAKLNSLGLNEVISNSLLSDSKTINYDRSIKVINPQSMEMSNLRTSLIPGMLQNISRNLKVNEKIIRFFEIGQVFLKNNVELSSFKDFEEHENIIIALCGGRNNNEWYRKESKYDFFDLSGVLNSLLKHLRLYELSENEYIEKGNEIFDYYMEKSISGKIIGQGGKIKKSLLDQFEIDDDVYLFEGNTSYLRQNFEKHIEFEPLLKFPKVFRDFGFIVDKSVTYEEVMKVILSSSSNLLKNVNLFDIFESESLGADKKSLAFQLEYYDYSRTLREDEIDKEFWQTIETVKKQLKAELRG